VLFLSLNHRGLFVLRVEDVLFARVAARTDFNQDKTQYGQSCEDEHNNCCWLQESPQCDVKGQSLPRGNSITQNERGPMREEHAVKRTSEHLKT
jgi:hypothetical protein